MGSESGVHVLLEREEQTWTGHRLGLAATGCLHQTRNRNVTRWGSGVSMHGQSQYRCTSSFALRQPELGVTMFEGNPGLEHRVLKRIRAAAQAGGT